MKKKKQKKNNLPKKRILIDNGRKEYIHGFKIPARFVNTVLKRRIIFSTVGSISLMLVSLIFFIPFFSIDLSYKIWSPYPASDVYIAHVTRWGFPFDYLRIFTPLESTYKGIFFSVDVIALFLSFLFFFIICSIIYEMFHRFNFGSINIKHIKGKRAVAVVLILLMISASPAVFAATTWYEDTTARFTGPGRAGWAFTLGSIADGSKHYLSQSFKPTVSDIGKIEVYIQKDSGMPSRSFYFRISSELNNGVPSGMYAFLWDSNSNNVGTSPAWRSSGDKPPGPVIAGNTYYLTLGTDDAQSATSAPYPGTFLYWWSSSADSSSGDLYKDGRCMIWNGNKYLREYEDFMFKIFSSAPAVGDGGSGDSEQNLPPNVPARPVGPTTVTVGNEHPYYVATTDPEREKVSYQFMIDYGLSEWSRFYDSGYLAALKVNFPYSGTYQISARAKDESGDVSDWSTKLYVTAEKKEEYIYPPQVTIYVTPGSIISGDFASVTWSSTNANSVSITPNINPTNAQIGSALVNPGTTTTYTAIALGSNGVQATAVCILDVMDPEPTVTLRADKTRINAGDLVKIYWSSENANSVSITQGITTDGAISGMKTANPQRTTTYVATASGNSGVVTDSLTIYVIDDLGGIVEGGESPLLFILVGILVVFILYNLIYFQRNKKWPPYKKYFKKILAWIKNEEYEDEESPKEKKAKDKSYYDYLVEYGEPDFDEAAYLYRRNKGKGKKKKKKGGEK